MPDEVAARFLRQVWEKIERRYAPEHVILFGSRAVGQARPDSDIDLILVAPCFEGQSMANRTIDVRREIQPHQYGLAMDTLCYTPEEFKVMGTGIGTVADAAREGIWIK